MHTYHRFRQKKFWPEQNNRLTEQAFWAGFQNRESFRTFVEATHHHEGCDLYLSTGNKKKAAQIVCRAH
jgi:hypothetical protein